MTTVDLVWFNAGGGHRAAATALEQGIALHGLPWQVRKLDLVEMLDPTALFRRVTGIGPEDLYNKRLSSGFTLGLAQELKLLQAGIRLAHGRLAGRVAAHWRRTRPDLVVSLIPNFNRALHDGLAAARPGTPFVTVMTDLADHPPRFWAEPSLPAQHLVCGTAHAEQQALNAGCARHRVHRVAGMLLRPDFYADPPSDRAQQRAALGLPVQGPVGLVLFGGSGSAAMLDIARAVPQLPLILLCGRNAELAARLRREAVAAPRIVLGPVGDVARWMDLADLFIGKPGPGSLSEAVQRGLPVLTTRNAFTLPQERWNTQWVRDHGLGIVMRRFDDVAAGVQQLVSDLDAFRARVRAVPNGALFEVPRLLHTVLGTHAAAPRAGAAARVGRRVEPTLV